MPFLKRTAFFINKMNLGKNTLKRLTKKTVLMLNHYRAYIYNNGYRSNPPRDILNF